MKFLLVFHSVLSAILTVALCGTLGTVAAFSFGCGTLVILFNLSALVYAMPRILVKKKVALPLALIVIKFAILGYIVHEVVVSKTISLLWFSAGLASVVISVVATSLFTSVTSSTQESAEIMPGVASGQTVQMFADSSSKVEN